MSANGDSGPVRFGGFQIDTARHCLIDSAGAEVSLRRQSFDVLQVLAEQHDTVVAKETLFERVWPDVQVTDDSLTQCVADIRRALGEQGHQVLRTVPRRGYLLVADEPTGAAHPTTGATAPMASRHGAKAGIGAIALVGVVLVWMAVSGSPSDPANDASAVAGAVSSAPQTAVESPTEPRHAPTLVITARQDANDDGAAVRSAYIAELRRALSRYRTITLTEGSTVEADYRLVVDVRPLQAGAWRILVDAVDSKDQQIFESREFDVPAGAERDADALRKPAIRMAAFASPAGGALAKHLMASAFNKPVEKLSRAECYAHAYDCTSCEGEVSTLTERTKACLARILEEDPSDPAAWALKASLNAHQYRWGSALDEPERSDMSARAYLKRQAIEAASKAEALSDGSLPVVYWGMVQAYHANCDADKLAAAAKRGLVLNPDDPGMLAVFGNFLAFSGRWEEGVAMVERAFELEPEHGKPWWKFPLSKQYFERGEYDKALQQLPAAFVDRSWASHLTEAYMAAKAGQLDEARQAVTETLRRRPGYTLENAMEYYLANCFSRAYREDVVEGLKLAGMPSRGEMKDIDKPKPIAAKLISVNGTQLPYVDVGQGEPVLFVHGGMGDYRGWGYYLLPISEKYRYLSYTQRYYGTRPWPERLDPPASLSVYADDLIAFIEALGAGPVHLVTWSFSGGVGVLAQTRRSDLFKSVLHYEPSTVELLPKVEPPPAVKRLMGRFQRVNTMAGDGDWQGAVVAMIEAVFEQEPGEFWRENIGFQRVILDNARTVGLFNQRQSPLTYETLGRITSPTMIVYGTAGGIFPRVAQRTAECIPQARLVTLEGVKHDGPLRKVDELVSLISAQVDAHIGSGRQ